jgi:hypothetical protein
MHPSVRDAAQDNFVGDIKVNYKSQWSIPFAVRKRNENRSCNMKMKIDTLKFLIEHLSLGNCARKAI